MAERSGKQLADRFLVGEELGRGAYSRVFKAEDLQTGTQVAIKQIGLSGSAQDSLKSVMGEIELLRTLHHENIVMYLGSFRTRTHLYIILEYLESGSLANVIKQCGGLVSREELVAVYVIQVLRGLTYLHQQGVVHRDIKGANILTTKDGVVKLADFGVSAKLGELEEHHRDELHHNIVGTPYWMAPEVIEMTQITPASDIWSVGCLVVEMLTGNPPYSELQPLSALFRIVQDDHPQLPDHISPLMEDFLLLCFQKDPKLRPSAEALLQHRWIWERRQTLKKSWTGCASRMGSWRASQQDQGRAHQRGASDPDAHESLSSVVNRLLEEQEAGNVAAAAAAAAAAAGAEAGPAGELGPEQDGSQGPGGTGWENGGAAAPEAGIFFGNLEGPDVNRYSDVGAAGSTAATDAAASAAAGSVPLPALQPSPSLLAREPQQQPPASPPDAAAAAAAGAPRTSPLSRVVASLQGPPLPASASHTLPVGGAAAAGRLYGLGAAAGVGATNREHHVKSLSDMLSTNGGGGAAASGGPVASTSAQPQQLPPGYRRTYTPHTTHGAAAAAAAASQGSLLLEDDCLEGPSREQHTKERVKELMQALRLWGGAPLTTATPTSSPSASAYPATYGTSHRTGSLPATAAAAGSAAAVLQLEELLRSQPEARAVFLGEGGVLVLLQLLETGNPKNAEGALDLLDVLVRDDLRLLGSLCLVGAVPAVCRLTQPGPGQGLSASGPDNDVLPQQAQQASPWPASLRAKAAAFVHRLCFASDETLRLFIACQGLKHLVGLVWDAEPAKAPAQPPRQTATHGQAAAASGAGGSPWLPSHLQQQGCSLTHVALSCMWRVLDSYEYLTLSHQCRLFAQLGLAPRLFHVLREAIQLHARRPASPSRAAAAKPPTSRGVPQTPPPASKAASAALSAASPQHPLDDSTPSKSSPDQGSGTAAATTAPLSAQGTAAKAGPVSGDADAPAAEGAADEEEPDPLLWLMHEVVKLLLVLSQADAVVKGYVCERQNPQQLLYCVERLQPHLQVKLMRALRHLTGEPGVVPAVKEAGAIPCLVPFLSRERLQQPLGAEVQLEAMHAMYNVCIRNKVHLEAAATAGITPHLSLMAKDATVQQQQQQHQQQWPRLRGFVVPLLIEMVSCSSSCRAKLWASDGMDVFLQLLGDVDWQVRVLKAMDTWLGEDHTRVEGKLTQRDAVAALVDLAARSHQAREIQAIPQLLDTLRQMIGRSSKLAVALAVGGLVPWLLAMIEAATPLLRVKLLEIIRCLYEHYPRPKEFILMYKIPDVLRRLLEIHGRGADAVHSACHQLLSAFQINIVI